LLEKGKIMEFKKAQRKQAKARVLIASPSGGGKTMSALLMAAGIGGKIAVIDSENGSASLYEGMAWCPDFDVLELSPPYTPEKYIDAIKLAEKSGYDTILVDSITHEWVGSGGCLELNSVIADAKFRGNTWSAWNVTNARHRLFLDAMIQSKCHVIATCRTKTETAQQEGASGKKVVVKLGMKYEQREGIEYEFTAVLDLVHEGHWATASKDRTGVFSEPEVITKATGERLKFWLESGVDFDIIEQQRIADLLAKKIILINACTNMVTLENVFKQAWQDLGNVDKTALTAAKDAKKEALTPV